MLTLPVRHGSVIFSMKQKEWLIMRRELSTSVKAFYPSYKRKQLLKLLDEGVGALTSMLPVKRVVLFGSWSIGKETVFSDIDLLVIYAEPIREDDYEQVRRYIKLRGLEPHVYSEQQAENLRSTLERMTENGIVLFPEHKEN